MGYASRTGLDLTQARLVELTDSETAPGVIDWGIVDDAVARADRKIDARLRGRYVIPLSPIDPIVVDWANAFARYFLYRHREKLPVPDDVRQEFQRAERDLDLAARPSAAGADSIELISARVHSSTPLALDDGAGVEVARVFGRAQDGLG